MDRLGDRDQPVGVCILDSGVEAHPDFGKRIVLFRDFVEERQGLYDDYGHGTHIAGISSGSGLRSKGRYRGIAAHSNLIIGKVLNHQGDGRIEDFIAAIYWCMQMQEKFHIRILNISVGQRDCHGMRGRQQWTGQGECHHTGHPAQGHNGRQCRLPAGYFFSKRLQRARTDSGLRQKTGNLCTGK